MSTLPLSLALLLFYSFYIFIVLFFSCICFSSLLLIKYFYFNTVAFLFFSLIITCNQCHIAVVHLIFGLVQVYINYCSLCINNLFFSNLYTSRLIQLRASFSVYLSYTHACIYKRTTLASLFSFEVINLKFIIDIALYCLQFCKL